MIRPLFKKYQKEILGFSNTHHGKFILGQFGKISSHPVVKVTPDSIHQKVGQNTYLATFLSRSPLIKVMGPVLTMCQIAEDNGYVSKNKELVIPHYLGITNLLRSELPTINLKTFNPDTHPEVTSVDGWTIRNVTNESFATIRAGAATNATDNESSMEAGYIFTGSSAYNQLVRSFLLFDTSSLPNEANIKSASIDLYVSAKQDDFADGSTDIVTSNPASNTAIVTADHTTLGTTLQATSINITSLSTSAYNSWIFNATGLSNINKSGVSKFGVRLSYDTSNTDPVWPGASQDIGPTINTAGGANKPRLVVLYSLPSGFFHLL